MSDKNVFLRAIDVLNERGWTQYELGDEDGPVCALGAIHYATVRGDGQCGPLCFPGAKHLHSVVRGNVADWNDEPHRTVEDVILALKEAAVSWDGD